MIENVLNATANEFILLELDRGKTHDHYASIPRTVNKDFRRQTSSSAEVDAQPVASARADFGQRKRHSEELQHFRVEHGIHMKWYPRRRYLEVAKGREKCSE